MKAIYWTRHLNHEENLETKIFKLTETKYMQCNFNQGLKSHRG